MKIIYKSLMTIAFAGLSLASCDKELKEETAMEVGCGDRQQCQLRWQNCDCKERKPCNVQLRW